MLKRLKIGITSAYIAVIIAIAIFIAANIEPVLDNAFTLLFICDTKHEITRNDHHYAVDCGDFNFTFKAEIDEYILSAGWGYNVNGPIVLSAIRKHVFNSGTAYFVSDYGYAVVTDLGKAYVLIESDKQEKLDGFDNIIYLSDFDEFAPEWQEQLEYLDKKIIFSY